MEKTISIEGMSCGHCSAAVEKELNAIPGVSATVSLEEKAAKITAAATVTDEMLRAAVEDAGYDVTGIV